MRIIHNSSASIDEFFIGYLMQWHEPAEICIIGVAPLATETRLQIRLRFEPNACAMCLLFLRAITLRMAMSAALYALQLHAILGNVPDHSASTAIHVDGWLSRHVVRHALTFDSKKTIRFLHHCSSLSLHFDAFTDC